MSPETKFFLAYMAGSTDFSPKVSRVVLRLKEQSPEAYSTNGKKTKRQMRRKNKAR